MKDSGFTLIELSIVLVIIGLIIGGILTGQDLINTATIRAQLTQIEKYNTAVRTFQGKYGFLPGDITQTYSTQFGFPFPSYFSATSYGNGDGLINAAPYTTGWRGQLACNTESMLFWGNLSSAGLIDGMGTAYLSSSCNSWNNTSIDGGGWLPHAKLGNNNYIYAWSGGWAADSVARGDSTNYFGLSSVQIVGAGTPQTTQLAMSVNQAYNIDKKIDDGMPQSGSVMAMYVNGGYSYCNTSITWAAGVSGGSITNGDYNATNCGPVATPATTAYSPSTCYDTSSSAGTETYSTAKNGGTPNCALSFKFQ